MSANNSEPPVKILLVTEDVDWYARAVTTLRRDGHVVLEASDAVAALRLARSETPDIALVDLQLTDGDGFVVCRALGQDPRVPVIALSSGSDEEQAIKSFLSGADDCVSRQVGVVELQLRMQAVSHRYTAADSLRLAEVQMIGDLRLDLESHLLNRNGTSIPLTPIEFRLLRILATNEGMVVSFSRLIEYAWTDHSYTGKELDALKTHVAHLRKKLKQLGGQPGDVVAIPGNGYTLPRSRKSS
jgi:two-component system OmpR family response regulator